MTKRPSKLLIYASCLFLLLFFSSNCSMKLKTYSIGIDPSFRPLILDGKENQLTAFSTEALQKIGAFENLNFNKVTVSWDNLMSGLQKKDYEAILSSIPPYSFNETLYDFSEPYLLTGPVLIVPLASQVNSLSDLNGKELALQPQMENSKVLEKNPNLIIRNYTSIPDALNALVRGDVDAALVNNLLAKAYIHDLYHAQLKIASEPLDNQGLRLITLHEKNPELIEAFNHGLSKLKKRGDYAKLEAKWGL